MQGNFNRFFPHQSQHTPRSTVYTYIQYPIRCNGQKNSASANPSSLYFCPCAPTWGHHRIASEKQRKSLPCCSAKDSITWDAGGVHSSRYIRAKIPPRKALSRRFPTSLHTHFFWPKKELASLPPLQKRGKKSFHVSWISKKRCRGKKKIELGREQRKGESQF